MRTDSVRLADHSTLIFIGWFFSQNASAAVVDDSGQDGDDEGGSLQTSTAVPTPPSTLMDRVTGVINSVKQQATETLDGNSGMLNRLQPSSGAAAKAAAATASGDGGGGSGGGGGGRITENRIMGDDALGRLQQTKGRAVAAAKKVMDETMHKLTSTVNDIKRTISGNDEDDEGGDRRVSNALDGLFRAVGSEGWAAINYASDVINETADRAKIAVEKQQQQKTRRSQK